MKKIVTILAISMMATFMTACSSETATTQAPENTATASAGSASDSSDSSDSATTLKYEYESVPTFETPAQVKQYLIEGNEIYQQSITNSGDVSLDRRIDTSENGQYPYAVVITCSDSRVTPEHVFNTGLGELFVIRNAGNVISNFELGSVEYGSEHLHAKQIIVLGHEHCGAVDATLADAGHDNIKYITDEIAEAINNETTDAREAEILNVLNSMEKIKESELVQELIAHGEVEVTGAIYNINDGSVTFLD